MNTVHASSTAERKPPCTRQWRASQMQTVNIRMTLTASSLCNALHHLHPDCTPPCMDTGIYMYRVLLILQMVYMYLSSQFDVSMLTVNRLWKSLVHVILQHLHPDCTLLPLLQVDNSLDGIKNLSSQFDVSLLTVNRLQKVLVCWSTCHSLQHSWSRLHTATGVTCRRLYIWYKSQLTMWCTFSWVDFPFSWDSHVSSLSESLIHFKRYYGQRVFAVRLAFRRRYLDSLQVLHAAVPCTPVVLFGSFRTSVAIFWAL